MDENKLKFDFILEAIKNQRELKNSIDSKAGVLVVLVTTIYFVLIDRVIVQLIINNLDFKNMSIAVLVMTILQVINILIVPILLLDSIFDFLTPESHSREKHKRNERIFMNLFFKSGSKNYELESKVNEHMIDLQQADENQLLTDLSYELFIISDIRFIKEQKL